MSDTQRTIEVLLQLKTSGTEALAQLKTTLADVFNPVTQMKGAVTGLATAWNKGMVGMSNDLKALSASVKSGELAMRGMALAAEGIWTAFTGPFALLYDAFKSLLGLLNPFSLQGLITGAITTGVGAAAIEMAKSADAAEVYRKRLGDLVGDQKIANRVFNEFEEITLRTGIQTEKLGDVFERLYSLGLQNADAATKTVAAFASWKNIDIEKTMGALTNVSTRSIRELNIQVTDLGKSYALTAGSIRVETDKTQQALRQGLIQVFAQELPAGLNLSETSLVTKFAIFRAQLAAYGQELGAILLPAFKQAMDAINGFLEEHREAIIAFFKTIPQFAEIAWQMIKNIFSSDKAYALTSEVLGRIRDTIGVFLIDLGNVILQWLALMIQSITAVLLVGIKYIKQTISDSVGDELRSVSDTFNNWLLDNMGEFLKERLRRFNTSARSFNDATGGLFESVIPQINVDKDYFGGDLNKIKAARQAAYDQDMQKTLGEQTQQLKTKGAGLIGAISDLGKDIKMNLGDLGKILGDNQDIAKGIKDLGDAWDNTIKKMRGDKAAGESKLPLLMANQPIDDTTIFAIEQLNRDMLERQLADNQHAYDQELAGFRSMTLSKMDSAETFQKFKEQLDKLDHNSAEYAAGVQQYEKMVRAKLEAEEWFALAKEGLDKKKALADLQANANQILALDQFNAAIQQGLDKQVADAQTAYDSEAAAWKKKQLEGIISEEQFNRVVVQLAEQREEKLRQIMAQRVQAANQINVLIAQSQHRISAQTLAQAKLDYDNEVEKYRQMLEQKKISQQAFNAAVEALNRQRAEKELEIEGSMWQGIGAGARLAANAVGTSFQTGMALAASAINGLADGMGQLLIDTINGTKSLGQAFRDMAASILEDLARIAARAAVLNALKSVFGGGGFGEMFGIGNMFGGFNDGGLIPGGGADQDSLLIGATPGEFMVRRSVVEQPGVLDFLTKLNRIGDVRSAMKNQGGQIAGMVGGQMTQWRNAQGNAQRGSAQVVTAVVGIGDAEIEKMTANPKFRAGVRREVSENKNAL